MRTSLKGKSDFLLTRNKEYLGLYKTLIPGGSTFSKNDLFKEGQTPFAAAKAKGSRIWDVDGNEYVDYIMGLGAILLGYQFPDVDNAVRIQLESGMSFSLMHPLEIEVAEKIRELNPNAEMIRFGKNGSDVTTAAVRLSRHITGRDHVLFCGYHGWHDWYVSQTSKAGGIPKCIGKLSHRFEYNKIETVHALIKEYPDNIACVIIDPLNRWLPEDGFLEALREITAKHGILLVFDEMVTGFRFHRGGIQGLYQIVPDLTCYGKALSNGMPLSSLVGKGQYMRRFDEIFYSLTFAGETLSLAAAKAALSVYAKLDVPGYIENLGGILQGSLQELIHKHDLGDYLELQGTPNRPILHLKNSPIYLLERKDNDGFETTLFFVAEMCKRGILFNLSNFISYSHSAEDISRAIVAYDEVFALYRKRLMVP